MRDGIRRVLRRGIKRGLGEVCGGPLVLVHVHLLRALRRLLDFHGMWRRDELWGGLRGDEGGGE